jgi:serine protease
MLFKRSMLAIGLLAASPSLFALSDDESVRVIIKFKHPTTVKSLQSRMSLPIQELKPMANGVYSLILNATSVKASNSPQQDIATQIVESLRKDPNVHYAVKDRKGYFKPLPEMDTPNIGNVLSHDSQWDEFSRPAGVMLESAPGLKDGAWAMTTGKSKKPIVVAVLDTGVELNDSLVNNLVKDSNGKVFGWNFAGNNNNISDETLSYHGTHVSGTIAGYGDVMNGIGVDLKVLTVKIPAADGMFYESAVVNGIYWAVGGSIPGVPTNTHPAKVLNMSFGVDEGPGKEIDHCDAALQDALFYARSKGAVVAVAAGNDNVWEHYSAPAACNSTIKVASTGPKGLRSYFSNYGPSVTFAAPGGDKRYGTTGGILSTVNPGGGYNGSGFDFYQGTSMASPHVAGVAGLVYAVSDKNIKPEKVEQILYTTTHDFGASTNENDSCIGNKPCGHGILDAERAVKVAMDKFDVLFTAPTMKLLATKACVGGLVSTKTVLHQEDRVWTLGSSGCQDILAYQHPQIRQEKDGSIYAVYGAVRYKLDQTPYRSCEQVGFDGVGCYR